MKMECSCHYHTLWPWTSIFITSNFSNFCIFENRSIEVNGLFCIIVEPEKWSNFLHKLLVALLYNDIHYDYKQSEKCSCKILSSISFDNGLLSNLETSDICCALSLSSGFEEVLSMTTIVL